MDLKKVEILSNMRFIPLKGKEEMYDTIVNYSRELLGARRIVFYVKRENWIKEYIYPSEEMIDFEIEEEKLEEIYKRFIPSILSFEEAREFGIKLEGGAIFLPLGTKECHVGLLLLAGIKSSMENRDEEIAILKIFSRYLELFIFSVNKLFEKSNISQSEDLLSDLKKDMISMVSRDIRTPLASVLAYAETLKEGKNLTEKEKGEFIDTLYEKSLELKEAADRLMDYLSMFMMEDE